MYRILFQGEFIFFVCLFVCFPKSTVLSLQPLIIIHKDLVKVFRADGAVLLVRCGYYWGFRANNGGCLQQLEKDGYSSKHLCYCGPAVLIGGNDQASLQQDEQHNNADNQGRSSVV